MLHSHLSLTHEADWHEPTHLEPIYFFSFTEPEIEDPPELGDSSKTPSEEDIEASQDKRSEAMAAMSDGDLQKAVDLFTEAIKLNPGKDIHITFSQHNLFSDSALFSLMVPRSWLCSSLLVVVGVILFFI